MNEQNSSETLSLTKYDKLTIKRNSFQISDIPDFDNSETISLTNYSKNTKISRSNSIPSYHTLNLTNFTKQTFEVQNLNESEITISLTKMTKQTLQKDVNIFGRRSF
ncbi:unnamed protein product [Paramecium sonneborni]|uniref:Uncharacterized protein n=1 Tax=Paramecium sonneborni TaxID=65129 RepID=A0A8S1KLW4_9CILI|nr:unnamed protein product [Paramecium sonneborni]